ncbi:LytTR family DNA-binding domain-containing protein [Polyangium sp. 15x6]|uniref:LytR/AlgR family response regulator transcription factor n=1 Tax=Polyangium sp. 15x6 TaxID=3042687 RepID=UPI002499EB33|nr:LytTR family DNA-binding domain-containing protein [Polyangium sp. 15x6]MDI3291387.1 LytTR family DNA-binding domain-containing protein [Polyangium sp. 15x6]
MKILVVDDEEPARRRLIRLLRDIPGTEVVGEAGDGEEALRRIEALGPELVLLDIRMPGLDGLSLAQRYVDLPPLVFITAYDEYAVQAFEVNAVDYLLKPVRPERLLSAVERARQRLLATKEAAARALSAVAGRGGPTSRIVTVTRGVIRLFDARDVTRFWSSDKYTLFRADREEHCTEEPLSTLEERLRAHGFLRVHRGELIHVGSVKALRSGEGIHEIELQDGQIARVSRRSLSALKAALGLAE